MALTIKHTFVSAIADDPVAAAKGEVLTQSHWNAAHTITGASDLIVGTSVVTGGTDNQALTVGGGTLGETPIRTILTATTNYYVTTTGNDSNNGSIGSPWATLQHAMNFIAENIDSGGFTRIINIGAGTFVGVGTKPSVGDGIILWLGAGSASTTINAGSNDGVFNLGECFGINVYSGDFHSINKVKFNQQLTAGNPAGNNVGILVDGPHTTIILGNYTNGLFTATDTDLIFTQDNGTSNNGAVLLFSGSFMFVLGGGVTFDRTSAGVNSAELVSDQGAFMQMEQVTFTLLGTPAYAQAFALVNDFGIIYNDSNAVTFVGGATGDRFHCFAHSHIDDGGQGFDWLPGNAPGIVDGCSSYGGSIGAFTGPFGPGAIDTQTANYVLALTDIGDIVEMNIAGANTLTVPANATVDFPIGTKIWATQTGAGATTVTAAIGVTGHNFGAVGGQWKSVKLYQRAIDEWVQTNA